MNGSLVNRILSVCIVVAASVFAFGEPPRITLSYIGHISFLIATSDGTRIVCDPYRKNMKPDELNDFPSDLSAQVVTISHGHRDHNHASAIQGNPVILDTLEAARSWKFGDIAVTGFSSWESYSWSPAKTRVIVFMFEIGGVKIVHLGDSIVVTDPEILKGIQNADIVIVNVDGLVIPTGKIMPFMKSIGARTIIPAHYSLSPDNPWNGSQTVDGFLASLLPETNVTRTDTELSVVPGMPVQVLVMTPLMLKK